MQFAVGSERDLITSSRTSKLKERIGDQAPGCQVHLPSYPLNRLPWGEPKDPSNSA